MCFRLIDAKKAQHPVSLLCAVLGVSRAGYYAWKDRPACERRRRDGELLDAIRAIHEESKATYGWPRIHAELRHRGVRASRKRVARLMREAGLSGMVAPAQGPHHDPRARASPPRRISCAATSRRRRRIASGSPISPRSQTWEGKLYLAVVVDCFSRRCVGWAMADHMRAELVVDALEMALVAAPPRHRPGPPHATGAGNTCR